MNSVCTYFSAYIKGLIEEKQKFIVFAHHMVMLDAISTCLRNLNVDFIRIDGTTKNNIRTVNQIMKQRCNQSNIMKCTIFTDAC